MIDVLWILKCAVEIWGGGIIRVKYRVFEGNKYVLIPLDKRLVFFSF